MIFAFVLGVVPMILLLERKLLGRFQARIGPNRVGPFGLLQPLADVLKLLSKEQSTPATAVPWMMAIAPAISIFTAVATLAIIPFGDVRQHGIFGAGYGLYGIDVSIGILWAFAFGALAFYGLMLGGWASGSKYSFLGAMRSAAQLISYEVSLGLSLLGVVFTAGSLSLTEIVNKQDGIWYVVPQFVGFCIFIGRVRGDQPAAVRPARGRRRDRGRLQHRVRRHALRLVLHGRVHQHDRHLGDRHGDVPRRLARTRPGVPRPALGDREDVPCSSSCSSGSARRCRGCATTS